MKPISTTKRRAVAAVGAAALTAAGIVAAQGGASAAPVVPHGTPGSHVISMSQLPKNAVRYTGPTFTPGATGPAFPSTGTATSGSSPRVVSGAPAQSSAFPGVVGIVTTFAVANSSGGFDAYVATCTGTVLSPTQILTAGHCDTDLALGSTDVIAGRNNLSNTSSGFVSRARSTWTDQSFAYSSTNVPTDDVSVITLWTALPPEYIPVNLTAQGDQTPYTPNTNATVVGYGETVSGDTSSAGTLNQATVPIQSDAICSAAMPGYAAATMTCAGNPNGGPDTCNGDSGGPLFVNGAEAAITDWGSASAPCGAAGTYGVYERLSAYNAAITTAAAQPPIINADFSGGGHADLMAVDNSGNLRLYDGSGFLNDGNDGFDAVVRIGSGWGGMRQVFRVTNWNNDNTESVMAVLPNGNLNEYPTDGHGNWLNGGNPIQIGTGWNMFDDIMVVNNWTGDGHADLLGRMPNGNLRLYESNGRGGWVNPSGTQIGTGWNMFNTILTPGTWNGDGNQVLIGRTPNGNLYEYESDSKGGWVNPSGTQIGTGWNEFRTFLSVGDWNGDGMLDMIGVMPNGAIYLYETNGHGHWITGQGILFDQGWTFSQIF